MNNINFRAPLGVLLLAAAIGACNNPVSPREDHSEPDGLVLRAGATELNRVDEEGVTGTLTAVVAAEGPELRRISITAATRSRSIPTSSGSK